MFWGHHAGRVFSQQKSVMTPQQHHVVESGSVVRECEAARRLPASQWSPLTINRQAPTHRAHSFAAILLIDRFCTKLCPLYRYRDPSIAETFGLNYVNTKIKG